LDHVLGSGSGTFRLMTRVIREVDDEDAMLGPSHWL
jgi:hypothetical protein